MDSLKQIKQDFPFFKANPHLHYLDSTATSLKPQSVISAVTKYYGEYSVNIHRGVYDLSEKATQEFEAARFSVARFINASFAEEIIFTKNATEGLNLLAQTLSVHLGEGDHIITSLLEHHSNFIPWQQVAKKTGAIFTVLGVTEDGEINFALHDQEGGFGVDNLEKIITSDTKIIALSHVSNVLGTINPIKEIAQKAKQINPEVLVVVDACQSVPHIPVDVQKLGCDFLVFSGHKMLGPTGVGVVWGKKELLEKLSPFLFGGEMIQEVSVESIMPKPVPHVFEAGTPHIAGVIGLKAAIEYLENIGMESVRAHEKELIKYALEQLDTAFGNDINVYGTKDISRRSGSVTFSYKEFHPHDVASLLNHKNIAVRAGQHCAMPLHTHLGVSASTRASFYVYSDKSDVDALVEGLVFVDKTLSR